MNKTGFLLVGAALMWMPYSVTAAVISNVTLTEIEIKDDRTCRGKANKWVGTGCSNWVSFQCNGPAAKDMAFSMLDTAQMAYALSKQVTLTVDSANKVDGFCIVKRIKLQP